MMGYFHFSVLFACLLVPLVACSCSDGLRSCKATQICERCAETKAICKVTADPLYCAHKLAEGCGCAWENDPCDPATNLTYGCHNKRCYSQCIGPERGENEWCYLRERKVGEVTEFPCETNEECESKKLPTSNMCGKCSTSFG